jgi:hypothetical protein
MKITEIGRHKLSFDAEKFTVACPNRTGKFSGLATSALPKLYVASIDGKPIYVGITKQPIGKRLRFGWRANGQDGYYGYAWRHTCTQADLDIWCHEDAPSGKAMCLDMETIEAEVVFLIRKAGQWPPYQTEIHFHPSNEEHRTFAAQVAQRYGLAP